MTLRDIHCVWTIAEEHSITKAAAKLFIAQPALSQCVQKVERELGVPLFIRNSAGVSPTAEGQCFLQFARKVLLEERNFQTQLEDLNRVDAGEINLGITGTQATYVLPNFLPKFKTRYPNIKINLIEAQSDKIEDEMLAGNVEVGILHPPFTKDNLDYFDISEDHMVIVPRSNSRFQQHIYYKEGGHVPYLDIEFLKDEPILVTQPWQRSRKIVDMILTNAGIIPQIHQVARSISTLDALVQVDYATAILPEKQMSDMARRRPHFRIDERYDVPYSFSVATMKGSYQSKATEKLIELLKQIAHTF